MKFKHLTMKLTAAAMTALLAFQNPIQAFAAAKPAYISDVLVSYAKSDSAEDIAEAKKWLTDKGYIVLGQDLNAETDNTVSIRRPVFLGYKLTAERDDAITDLRLMNMNGDYSYDDYKDLLKQQATEIGYFIDSAKSALAAYRENFSYVQNILGQYGKTYKEIDAVLAEHADEFDSGCYRAMITYENLNCLKDDDTGYLLGDLLLEPIREEMTSDDGQAHADMTTILMQGNSATVARIMASLAYVADTDIESTWLNRAEESDGLQGLLKRYEDDNPAAGTSRIQQLAMIDYDMDAGQLAEGAWALQDFVSIYESSKMTLKTDSKDIEAYFDDPSHSNESITAWLNGGVVAEGLKQYSVDGQSLYDLLLNKEYDFNKDTDRALLYPVVDAMNEAQRALLPYVSLDKFVLIALNGSDTDSWEEAYKTNRSVFKNWKPESVYNGVNRAMFNPDGGTALTRTALDHQTATHESYIEGMSDSSGLEIAASLAKMSVFSFITGVALLKGAKMTGYIANSKEAFNATISKLNNGADTLLSGEMGDTLAMQQEQAYFRLAEKRAASGISRGAIMHTVGVVVCVAAALMMIAAGVIAVIEMVKARSVDYKRIPQFIVHGTEQKKKAWESESKWRYTYYSAVKCNRNVEGVFSKRDNVKEMSDCADLNGDAGKQWVALYMTKDPAAGEPIVADSLAVGTSNKPPIGKYALTYFGEEYAANLNNPNYVFNANAPAVYIYFSHSTATMAGSVHNGAMAAILATGSALAGGLLCYFAVSRDGRKRREEDAA